MSARITVYGAGAIGGHLAARLAAGGATVSVVARGPHLAAMQREGLRVEAPDGVLAAPVFATGEPREIGVQDLVVVSVKAPALASVAAGIGPLLGPATPVAFVMNGIPWWYFHRQGSADDGRRLPRVDPGDAMWNAVGPARALGGVIYSACTVTRPGVVHVETRRNRLVLGEPDGALTGRAEALAAPLRRGGFAVEVTDRIRDHVWEKLLLNLCSGPMGVVTQSGTRALFEEEACRAAARRVVEEGAAVARAVGCAVAPDPEAMIAGGSRLAHKSSIVQDLELGRPMEIDALYDAPLEMARRAGVRTPTLDLLVSLVKVRARAAGLY